MFGNRRMRRPSHSTVVSYLALFVALGGTGAYAADTIGSSDIINESILAEDVQGQAASGGNPAVDGTLTTNEIKNGALRSSDIMNGTLQAEDLGDGSVGSGAIIDGSVANADLLAGAVNGASVLNESLTSSDLATDSVNATEVANDSIDSGEISNDSLLSVDLAGASVGSSELQDSAVGNAELASNAVNSAKVANNTLTTADILGADVNGGGISIPAGYVPNGRCRQLDANIGGAKAGEAVVFSTKAALQNGVMIYGQRVPSDGHVTFSACNFSGTTQATISDLPVRLITFG